MSTTLPDAGPALSLIVPCYNEAEVLDQTIPDLWRALVEAEPDCELILVDNGSTDGTPAIIERLCAVDGRVRSATVPENVGYGLGVLTGYRAARGRCVGHVPADGPVFASDVAALGKRALHEGPGALFAAVRQNRQDILVRRVVSRGYNLLFRVLFGRLTPDMNGTPKFLHREDLERIRPVSRDYFLEAEMTIKARRLGMRLINVEIPSRPREGGQSKVTSALVRTCAEFVRNIVRARFGRLPAVLLGMIVGW